MLITKPHWKALEFLSLGFQSNKETWREDIQNNAYYWAKKHSARSFTIADICHTDYNGTPSETITGYGNYSVYCYSTKSEGKDII